MGYFVWHQLVVGATGWAALGLALVKPEPNHSGVIFFTCRKRKKGGEKETKKCAYTHLDVMWLQVNSRKDISAIILAYRTLLLNNFLNLQDSKRGTILYQDLKSPLQILLFTYRCIQQSSCLRWREQCVGQLWCQRIPSASTCCRDPEEQNCEARFRLLQVTQK